MCPDLLEERNLALTDPPVPLACSEAEVAQAPLPLGCPCPSLSPWPGNVVSYLTLTYKANPASKQQRQSKFSKSNLGMPHDNMVLL